MIAHSVAKHFHHTYTRGAITRIAMTADQVSLFPDENGVTIKDPETVMYLTSAVACISSDFEESVSRFNSDF